MADTLANYVKFLRGTPTAYNNLLGKDSDTLYFVSEKDATTGKLYLGEVLISGSLNEEGVVDYLSELKDVDTTGAEQNSVLGFDKTSQKWKVMDISSALTISVMGGATAETAGAQGLVPAPEAGQQNHFLRGDGKWVPIEIPEVEIPETQVFETEIRMVTNAEGATVKETQDQAIIRVVDTATPVKGDIAIIKDPIAEDKFEYTAYVYDGAVWAAMDGNYSASNVYLKDQIVLAGDYGKDSRNDAITSIGNLRIGNVIPAGTSLQSLLMDILSQRLQPTITKQPSASITLYRDGASKKVAAGIVEVGTVINPSYTASLSSGSYTYGPNAGTGVVATSYSVASVGRGTVDGAIAGAAEDSATTSTGSFDSFTVDDSTNYYLTVSIPHSAGVVAEDNLGSPSNPEVKINSGTKTATSGAISGYRAWFCGYKNGDNALPDATAITGAQVRALGNAANGSWLSSMNVSQMKQMFFAAPAGKGYKPAVADSKTTAPQTVLGPITVYVPGANNYTAAGEETEHGGMAYDVWYVSNTAAAAGEATLNIKRAQ